MAHDPALDDPVVELAPEAVSLRRSGGSRRMQRRAPATRTAQPQKDLEVNPRMPTRRALDIVAIGLAVLVAACAPAATETPAPTATSSPLASASGLSPDLAFEVWTTTFEDAFAGWSDLLADAVEADYDWIESVDRVGYDATANRIVLIVTVPTEEALIADGDAWRSTSWPVFRDVGEVVWAGLVDEATADGGALSTFAD